MTVALGAGGSLSATYLAPAGARTDLIFDVTGYFVPDASGATYVALPPARLLDSRVGNGLAGKFSAGMPRTFQVTGRGGVPANAVAVTGNLTVTNQTAAGYVFLGPNPTPAPTSSTLNFPLGDSRANGVTVALGVDGSLSATYLARRGGKHRPHLRRDRLLRARAGRVATRPRTAGRSAGVPPARSRFARRPASSSSFGALPSPRTGATLNPATTNGRPLPAAHAST